MAYYETINVVAGDSKPDINLTLKDANTPLAGLTLDPDDSSTWALIDITDPTVLVKFRLLGSSTILDTMTCVKIAPYTGGNCYMPWNVNTLNVAAGTYEGEIELTYTSGKTLTIFDRLKFKVRADF
tara:strand:- start:2657 stop:3034 length:378 start_codon:yes stop_codon:yes gene_type:complete